MFILPQKLDSFLATLSQLYEKKSEHQLSKIVVNLKIKEVVEGVEHDNWDGGIDGHRIVFSIPELIFYEIFEKLDDIQTKLKTDLNQIAGSIRHEYICELFIDKEDIDRPNWRLDSGLLLQETHTVTQAVQKRLWEDDKFRLFISHKTEDKHNVSMLKKHLSSFGISCFVAHEDIEPTQLWADEIENALFSMDACVALMTKDYHNSTWTDHEVGCAYGRHVPVIAVRLGQDPYGLIGRFQALSATWNNLPYELMKLLLKYSSVVDAYIKSVASCGSFEQANELAHFFQNIKNITPDQIDRLIDAWQSNPQARESFGFSGEHSTFYGPGIRYFIRQWVPERFPDENSITRYLKSKF